MSREYSGGFLRDMIHDLINPLSSITGFLDLLLSPDAKDPLTHRQRRWLVAMGRSSQHFLGMMRDISDLSLIEEGGWKPSRRPVDLKKAADRVFGHYGVLAQNRGIALALEAPKNGPAVPGDEHMLERFFDALLRAAGRLTPEKGRIVLRLAARGDGAAGSLEHTGEVLPAVNWEEAFTASLKGPRPAEGYAVLGAALARAIARLHGGDVEAAPRPGGGTVFRFHFQ